MQRKYLLMISAFFVYGLSGSILALEEALWNEEQSLRKNDQFLRTSAVVNEEECWPVGRKEAFNTFKERCNAIRINKIINELSKPSDDSSDDFLSLTFCKRRSDLAGGVELAVLSRMLSSLEKHMSLTEQKDARAIFKELAQGYDMASLDLAVDEIRTAQEAFSK
jgi:hypothetical protein